MAAMPSLASVPSLPSMMAADAPEPAARGDLGDLRGELASMRSMLERQFAGLANTPAWRGRRRPAARVAVRMARQRRLLGQLSRTLLAHLPVGTDRSGRDGLDPPGTGHARCPCWPMRTRCSRRAACSR